MGLKLWLPFLLLAVFTIDFTDTSNDDQLNQMKEGVQFADHLTSAMKSFEFMSFLETAAPNALSFISATIKFVSLIFSFPGNNESQELLAIKQLYNGMNRRFDVIDNELQKLERKLNWTRVSNQFSKTERDINTVSRLFKNIYESPLSIRDSQKKYFKQAYESTCTNCALNLYNGIMGINKGLSDDILQTAMTSLQYDRPRMQTFMLGLLKLLVLALNNELAYRKFNYSDSNYLYTKYQWESRLYNVTRKMRTINELIPTTYHNQAEKDVVSFSIEHPSSSFSNQNFSKLLYDFLVQKYDLRDWLVIVYKPISGTQYHINHVCEGYRRYGMYGRDILIASVDQTKQPINTTVAKSIIDGVKTTYTTYGINCAYMNYCIKFADLVKRNAEQVYLLIPGETRDCNVYASVGVIDSWVDLWYHGKPQRLVQQRTPGVNSYSIHLFG